MRTPEKRIRKLGWKKRHFLIPKKARLWNVTLFNLLLKHDWFSCQAVTYCVLSVFSWSFYKNVLCAIQTTPPTACQGKGRTCSAWNTDCFDFRGKRTLLNCCWFRLIHVWFCDAAKVRSEDRLLCCCVVPQPPRLFTMATVVIWHFER